MPIYNVVGGEYHQNNIGINSNGNEPRNVFLAKMQLLEGLFKTSEFNNSPIAATVVSIASKYPDPKVRNDKVDSYLQLAMKNAYQFDSPISERQYDEASRMWRKFLTLEPHYKKIQTLAPKIKKMEAAAAKLRPNSIISRIIEICSFSPDISQCDTDVSLYLFDVSKKVESGKVFKEDYEAAKDFWKRFRARENTPSFMQDLEEMIEGLRSAEKLTLSFEELGMLCSFGEPKNQSFGSFESADNPLVETISDRLNAARIYSPGIEEFYITQLKAIRAERFPLDCFTSILSEGKLTANDLQAIKNVIESRLKDPNDYYALYGMSASNLVGEIEEALNHPKLTPENLRVMSMLVDTEMANLTSGIDRTSSFGKS